MALQAAILGQLTTARASAVIINLTRHAIAPICAAVGTAWTTTITDWGRRHHSASLFCWLLGSQAG